MTSLVRPYWERGHKSTSGFPDHQTRTGTPPLPSGPTPSGTSQAPARPPTSPRQRSLSYQPVRPSTPSFRQVLRHSPLTPSLTVTMTLHPGPKGKTSLDSVCTYSPVLRTSTPVTGTGERKTWVSESGDDPSRKGRGGESTSEGRTGGRDGV